MSTDISNLQATPETLKELQERFDKAYLRCEELKREMTSLKQTNLRDFATKKLQNFKNEITLLELQEKNVQKKNTQLKEEVEKLQSKCDTLETKYRLGQMSEGIFPQARRDDTIIDTYQDSLGNEVCVQDPYQALEDNKSKETTEWINSQVLLTNGYLNKFKKKDIVKKTITDCINYPKYGCPSRKSERFFYHHNNGLQNQYVLYTTKNLEDEKEEKEVLIDPNKLSEDGTTSLGGSHVSHLGTYLAYALKRSGSDWSEYYVKNIDTKDDLKNDHIKWCKFTSVAWTHDDKGFYYNRYKTPEVFSKEEDTDFKRGTETDKLSNQLLYYHRINTSQDDDIFILDAKLLGDVEWLIGPSVSYDGKYLLVYISKDCDPINKLYIIETDKLDFSDKNADNTKAFNENVIKLVDNFDFGYDYVTNNGSLFFFTTNRNAPNYQVVTIDISQETPEFKTLIPEDKKNRLSHATCVGGDKLLLNYTEDVKDTFYLYDFNGKLIEEANIMSNFPAAGEITSSGRRDNDEIYFRFTSFLYPGSLYKYDTKTFKLTLIRHTKLNFDFNPDEYTTKQIWYESKKDKCKVPMYIVHRKDAKLNGNNPCLLYGYGGFDISILPYFSVTRLLFLNNMNGIYALANIRGGGEFGEKWHKMGCKANKQNVFDDFISAGEYLIENKYTSNKKLVIQGGSNGGLLVAACANQRPDLFGCVLCQVGVLDMLKFHKFTIGYAWTSDFGCSDKPEEFDALYKYSPYHNIPKNLKIQYPSFMAFTADHDDRVVPLHTFKFMANLQYWMSKSQKKGELQKNPLVTRIELKAGHGAGVSLEKKINEITDTFVFICLTLGITWKE